MHVRVGGVGIVTAEQGGDIGKDSAPDSNAFGYQRHGELGFGGCIDVGRAADEAAVRIGNAGVAGADSGIAEAADHVAAALERVKDAQPVVAELLDVTAADANQTDNILLCRQRLVEAAFEGGFEKAGIAAKPGRLLFEFRVEAVVRVFSIIDGVVDK